MRNEHNSKILSIKEEIDDRSCYYMSSEEDGEDVDQVTGISGKNAAVIN